MFYLSRPEYKSNMVYKLNTKIQECVTVFGLLLHHSEGTAFHLVRCQSLFLNLMLLFVISEAGLGSFEWNTYKTQLHQQLKLQHFAVKLGPNYLNWIAVISKLFGQCLVNLHLSVFNLLCWRIHFTYETGVNHTNMACFMCAYFLPLANQQANN